LPRRLHVLPLALVLAGCGSAPASELPPAATLPAAAAASATPAGRVVDGPRAFPDPARASAGSREYVADRGANVLRVLERGREIARLPTALGPASVTLAKDGREVAVLCARGRVLELFDTRSLQRIGRADAGSGPVQVASNEDTYFYVTDAIGGSVLVFHSVPELTLVRRYGLEGNPWAIALDAPRSRLWVTLAGANRLVEMTTGRRIRRVGEFASVEQPSAVAVDGATVAVKGREQVQLLVPRSP
jgi:DNA-binding beta-propeller fold protein YncE